MRLEFTFAKTATSFIVAILTTFFYGIFLFYGRNILAVYPGMRGIWLLAQTFIVLFLFVFLLSYLIGSTLQENAKAKKVTRASRRRAVA